MEKAFACYSFSQPKPSILVAKSQVYVVFDKCFPGAILYVFYVLKLFKDCNHRSACKYWGKVNYNEKCSYSLYYM